MLFNNRKCYVVPPGMVDEIMTRVKPIIEYDRVGGLYLADLTCQVLAGRMWTSRFGDLGLADGIRKTYTEAQQSR